MTQTENDTEYHWVTSRFKRTIEATVVQISLSSGPLFSAQNLSSPLLYILVAGLPFSTSSSSQLFLGIREVEGELTASNLKSGKRS